MAIEFGEVQKGTDKDAGDWLEAKNTDTGEAVVLPASTENLDIRDAFKAGGDAGWTWKRVLKAKDAAGADWAKNRGPDSEIGRNQEAGTPTTDHSSER